jgi:phosphopantothenoylcysteine decarboxylase / phosphopantothenate---cysteine ligase
MLKGKKVIVAVSGSIAAYKSLLLVRLLIKEDCNVKVIMTKSATSFVAPLSFSTLSTHKVEVDLFENDSWNNHVELGLWADLMIIAPASANTIAKAANGICDNMLMATYLSAKCPVVFAPAMDLDMYVHPSTKANLTKLKSFGNHVIEATHGELASGLIGHGRMEEPENIVGFVNDFISKTQSLNEKRVLITAGPTYEAIDPVRFIGNHSSGKMGIAITNECIARGAKVTVILGPTHLSPDIHDNLTIHRVSSASEMLDLAIKIHHNSDICIFAAAVADYRVKEIAEQKIKKSDSEFTLQMVKNVDIAFELGKKKSSNQIHVGFALETENEQINAQSKLEKKNFDLIVLNSTRDSGSGFKHDTNKITIIDKNGAKPFDLKNKDAVAVDILDHVELTLSSKK